MKSCGLLKSRAVLEPCDGLGLKIGWVKMVPTVNTLLFPGGGMEESLSLTDAKVFAGPVSVLEYHYNHVNNS